MVLLAAGVAIGLVALMKGAGASPQLQRVVAFVVLGSVLVFLVLRYRAGPDDSLSAAAAVIGICAVAVAALTYVGSVDKDPAFGCINTNGPLQETVSGETTIVYSGATPESSARKLLLRGCELHGVAWCVGAVHEDAIEPRVFDARWLVLSGDQGLVPVGRTVGTPLPEDKRDDNCGRGVSPPDAIEFSEAALDSRSGLLAVHAQTEHVAFIGFALRRSENRWQRIGWDYEPDDELPVVLPAPVPRAHPGDEVEAVACLGYRQPAIADGTAVSASVRLGVGSKFTGDRDRVATKQPYAATPEGAACTSSVPRPALPYESGSAPGVR
jgi:hypothetical protein